MELGRESKEQISLGASPSGGEAPKIIYPSFSLSDKAAEEFLKEQPVKIGEEVAFTGRMKLVGQRDDEFGKNLSFDVLEIDDIAHEEDGTNDDKSEAPGEDEKDGSKSKDKESDAKSADDADDEETRVLGYKRPNKSTGKEVKASSSFLDYGGDVC